MQSLLLLLLACGEKDTDDTTTTTEETVNEPGTVDPDCMVGQDPDDMDCDGYSESEGDCDDSSALVYPGATEIPYDGRDNDCAGDGDLNDFDGDGYIGIGAEGGDDCDDNNPNAYPGAVEICYDGIDQNCAGDVELENNNDCDGDGFIGRGSGATDCNDEDPDSNPDAEEIWYDGYDSNCDGWDDFDQDMDGDPIAEIDIDGDGNIDATWDLGNDGYLEYEGGSDCDDLDPLTSPLFTERWDGHDRDCDGIVDGLVTDDTEIQFDATYNGVEGGVGMSGSFITDITGDGIAEIAIGAPYSNFVSTVDEDGAPVRVDYTGAVYIVDPTDPDTVEPAQIVNIVGSTYSYFGWDMAYMGDLDGGGVADLLVGAPGLSKAFLYRGEDLTPGATLLLSDAYSNVSGVGFAGVDIANIGDVNGDGLAEVAIGGSFVYTADAAWVGVWDGAALGQGGSYSYSTALFTVDSTADGTTIGGDTIGGADLDGDGLADMIVASAVNSFGRLSLASGADIAQGGSIAHSDLPSITGNAGEQFGRHSAMANDIDGDGYAEIVTSAGHASAFPADGNEYDLGGVVYVIDGHDFVDGEDVEDIAYINIQGTQISSSLQVIDDLGDHDGDGLTDVVVSAVNEDYVTNQVSCVSYIFNATQINGGGSFDMTAADSHILSNRYSLDLFGYFGTIGDMDADGDDDLLIGGPRSDFAIGSSINFDGIFGLGHMYVFESELTGNN